MSNFKEDPSEWAESDEREIHPDATVLRDLMHAGEAARTILAQERHVTGEEVGAADRGVYITRDEFGRILDVATSHYRPGGGTAHSVTAEQVEDAAHALFRQVFGHGWEDEVDGVKAFYRSEVREILTAAGLTVPEEEA